MVQNPKGPENLCYASAYLTAKETPYGLVHTARSLSLATEIFASVVSDEKEFLAYLILKIFVSDKNLLYVFPAHSKFLSPATKIFVLSDKNRAVCARLYLGNCFCFALKIAFNTSCNDIS